MKRICIISDIHGNLSALKIFLEYIEKHYDIEYILNLGDFLQNGPNQCEVFDIVMKDSRFINIMGNCEYDLIYGEHSDEGLDEGEVSHELWTKKELGKDRLNELKHLPFSKSIEIYGINIFMMHTRGERVLQIPSEYPFSAMLTKLPLQQISSTDIALTITEHDYLFVAENHVQGLEQYSIFEDEGYSFIQPGAIGCLDIGDIKFAVLEIGESEENIVFKTLKYDCYKVIEECNKKEVADPTHGIYLNKLKTDKDYYDLMISNKYAEDLMSLNFSFWSSLVTPYLERGKYIIFGIWNDEKELLEELKRKLDIINVEYSKETNEIFIKVRIDENAKQLLIENNLNGTGLIKWFNILIHDDNDSIDISVGHYGCEIVLNKVKKEDVEYIKSIIDLKMFKIVVL